MVIAVSRRSPSGSGISVGQTQAGKVLLQVRYRLKGVQGSPEYTEYIDTEYTDTEYIELNLQKMMSLGYNNWFWSTDDTSTALPNKQADETGY